MIRTGTERPTRTLTFGILGAAALAVGLLLVRQQRDEEIMGALVGSQDIPAGESHPGTISLDRIRAVGY
jgi:hypothetical protein